MDSKTSIIIFAITFFSCVSVKDIEENSNNIIGKWNIISVERNDDYLEYVNEGEIGFLDLDYTEIDGYFFLFKKDGEFDQNFFEPLETEPKHHYEWEVKDSILTTYFMAKKSKEIFIKGQFELVGEDQLILITNGQTVTFERME
jgi:hypothetical protein